MIVKALVCSVVLAMAAGAASAAPTLHPDVLGRMLGGWDAKKGKAADYEISGTKYRTWQPHVTPSVDGGMFVSVRIDHLRGLLASDDHASLELSFDRNGEIVSAQSTIALQGRKITSDLIQGSTKLGTSAAGLDRVVKVGTDLVGSLTAKMLREKVTEPGRVGFPAAVRHNYNLLCMAIANEENRAVPLDGEAAAVPVEPEVNEPETEAVEPAAPEETERTVPELKINQQGTKPVKPKATLPVPPKK